MSHGKIFTVYVLGDLLIAAGVVWAALGLRWPAKKFLLAAAALFILNGLWLVIMTIKNTPGSQ